MIRVLASSRALGVGQVQIKTVTRDRRERRLVSVLVDNPQIVEKLLELCEVLA